MTDVAIDHEMDAEPSLNDLALAAMDGDGRALTALVQRVQHPLYQYSLQFLGHPQDAQDATQEILVLLVTRLTTFEGRSKFLTWAYTVATRHLIRTKKRHVESSVRGAGPFAELLDRGLAAHDFTADEAEYRMLCDEVRISCTYGMLLCLSREPRSAYLLGDVLGIPDTAGAEICQISPAAFRQRLSRARRTIRRVIDGRCGLVDPSNPCRCGRQIQAGLDLGHVDRVGAPLARHPRRPGDAEARRRLDRIADQIDTVVAIGELYRADRFAAPSQVWQKVREVCPDLVDSSPGQHQMKEARQRSGGARTNPNDQL